MITGKHDEDHKLNLKTCLCSKRRIFEVSLFVYSVIIFVPNEYLHCKAHYFLRTDCPD